MHLSMLIPGGKGAGNGWGFNRELYPHRRAFVKVFCPGAGDLPFDIIQHAISVRSLEPRMKKTGKPDCIVCKTCAGCLKLSFIMRACSLLRRNMRAKLCTLIVTRAVFPQYTIQII